MSDVSVGIPSAANSGVPTDSGPYSNSVTKTSPERISSVTPTPKSPRSSGIGNDARCTTARDCSGRVHGRAAHDAAFPSARYLEADAVRGEAWSSRA